MKFLYKLTRNGNATTICIPVRILEHMRWRAGDPMIIEINGKGYVQVRPPVGDDMRASGAPIALERSMPEQTP